MDDNARTEWALRRLGELMDPQTGAGDTVDWTAVEERLGTALPEDFRRFLARYGAGTIDGMLIVLSPDPEVPAVMPVSRLSPRVLEAPEWRQWNPSHLGRRHRAEDMLVWGLTAAADTLCWLTEDPDPQRWPVAVWARHGGGWNLYDCGMAEFLLGLFHAEFDDCPISDTGLWGNASPRFLGVREEARLMAAGVDPWDESG
ncbi:MAG: SMI1/KNR4 family protein [Streptomyces sp.]|nr:SMI1/KNR4 family protein [Streptomyces sp.]